MSYFEKLAFQQESHTEESGPIIPHPKIVPFKLPLPEHYEWGIIDLENPTQLEELYQLLLKNYLEDADALFRMAYSKEFLKWALTGPGWIKDLNISILHKGELVGFINGMPNLLKIDNDTVKAGIVDFLCIHHDHRGKNLAPILVKELIRRGLTFGFNHAIFTCGEKRACAPLGKLRFMHRPINVERLKKYNFWHSDDVKQYPIPKSKVPGFREMRIEDLPSARKFLNKKLEQKRVHCVYSEESFKHIFMPWEDVMQTYIVEKDGEVTDFISFYHVPSTCLGKGKILSVWYLFHAYSDRLLEVFNSSLHEMKSLGADVINFLNFGHFDELIDENVALGTGAVEYYLYNWKFQKPCTRYSIGVNLV